jgi:putative transposase
MDSYHGRELRKGRHSEPGRVYLLTSVTHCRRPYFNHWQTGRLLVSQLRHSDNDGLTHTLAYVVMPDHLHWLVELKTGCLSDVMRRIKSRSAIDINRRLGGKGKI